jgi:hypothetical protein
MRNVLAKVAILSPELAEGIQIISIDWLATRAVRSSSLIRAQNTPPKPAAGEDISAWKVEWPNGCSIAAVAEQSAVAAAEAGRCTLGSS